MTNFLNSSEEFHVAKSVIDKKKKILILIKSYQSTSNTNVHYRKPRPCDLALILNF